MNTEAITLFAMIVAAAAPFAVTFYIGQLIVNTFMSMAFGGKVSIKI